MSQTNSTSDTVVTGPWPKKQQQRSSETVEILETGKTLSGKEIKELYERLSFHGSTSSSEDSILVNTNSQGDQETKMSDPYEDKYIDQRFINIENELNHKMEVVTGKIDSISDKINDNTDWMKTLVGHTIEEIDSVKTSNKQIKWHIWGAVISMLIGVSAILISMYQLQNSWLQEYLRILTEAFTK